MAMNEQMFYIIKLLAGSGAMYLGYRMFLSRSPMLVANRIYLMLGLVLPMLLPFFSLTELFQSQRLPVIELQVTEAGVAASTVTASGGGNPFTLWPTVYLLGILLLTFGFVYRLLRVFRVLAASRAVRFQKLLLHFSGKESAPFSFFNHILIPFNFRRGGTLRSLITHEAAHIRQGHSFDIIFTEFICILQWFNPFVWLIRKAVRENHEYLADLQAIRQNGNPAGYRALLLESLTGIRVPVVNSFNQPSIKKRFIMLNKAPAGQRSYLRTLATFVLLVLFAFPVTMLVREQGITAAPADDIFVMPDDTAFQPAHPLIKAESGDIAGHLAKLLKYPENARKAGKTGLVRISLKVAADGTPSGHNVQSGFDPECDAEALRMVKSLKWEPARKNGKPVSSELVYPVRFALDSEKPQTKSEKATPEDIFQVVDEMPEFPGGHEGRAKYMAEVLKYPEKARKAGTTGTVYVTFVIEKDGSVSNARVLRGIGNGCDEAALEAVRNMPAWKPGKQRGEEVRVQFNMPVKFALEKDGKKKAGSDETTAKPAPETPDAPDAVFNVVETMPEFPGGQDARHKYIASALKYPDEAKKAGTTGTVYITFVVETDGSISDAKVLRGIGHGCDEAALEAVRNMPKWKPGMQRGKAVRVQFNMPIRFALDDDKKQTKP